jgi:hypothetical protein
MVKRHKVGEGGPEEEERQRQRREALKRTYFLGPG